MITIEIATPIDELAAYFDTMHGVSNAARTLLLQLYAEPHRIYHNAEHIMELLDLARTLPLPKQVSVHDQEALRHTIIWHDAVYYKSKLNEELSLYVMSAFYTNRDVETVKAAIFASASHCDPKWEGLPYWAHYFLDLDLYGLSGKGKCSYEENAHKIWAEAKLMGVSRQDFYKGRQMFLKNMLCQPRTYRLLTDLEDAARANMTTELEALNNGQADFGMEEQGDDKVDMYFYGDNYNIYYDKVVESNDPMDFVRLLPQWMNRYI